MSFVTHHPSFVFVLSFLGLWGAACLGALLKRRRKLDEEARQDLNIILAATLTLLGLLIGFSFSMATARYDQRKAYEEAEANAIGTEYLRADLLSADAAFRVRALLKQYTELRVRFYTALATVRVRWNDGKATVLRNGLRYPRVSRSTRRHRNAYSTRCGD